MAKPRQTLFLSIAMVMTAACGSLSPMNSFIRSKKMAMPMANFAQE
jgi:hypothetical protein